MKPPIHLNIARSGILAVLLFSFMGCTKQNKITPVDFSYTVSRATVQFTSTAPQGSSLIWSFGDKGTSTDATPSHTYTDRGSKTVTLTVNGDHNNPITKTITLFAQTKFTADLCGSRQWLFTDITHVAEPTSHFDTAAYNLPKNYAINYVDRYTVSSNEDLMTLDLNYPDDSVLHFHSGVATGSRFADVYYNFLNRKTTYTVVIDYGSYAIETKTYTSQ